MALPLRHVPDQRRALAAAELHRAAWTRLRRSSHRRDHSRPEPRLYGSRLLRRANARMESRAHHRDGHPVDLGRHAGPGGGTRRQPLLHHVAPRLPAGRSWNDYRETVADLMIETVDRYAPGFKASVVGRQALSPLDLEQVFGLTGGDIFHGAMALDQLFWARPAIGYADYRGPLKGL